MFSNEYDISDIRKDITNFKNDFNVQQLKKYYTNKSMSEILGVSRKELQHSKFLSWILDTNESHNTGTFSIKKLLDIIVLYSKISDDNQELFDLIITNSIKIEDAKVEVEKSIKVGRLDIFVSVEISENQGIDTINLIIENKVTASETKDQTSRYYEYFNSIKNDNERNFYIYLTPISTLKLIEQDEPECKCKDFIQINYQTIVDLIIEPLLIQDISEKTKYLLNDYLQSLSQPSFDENNEHQEGLIMAIGNQERELLTKFWNNNQNLILASLYAMSSDPEQDKDVRDSITDAIDKISDNTKDRSLIDIKYKDNIVVNGIKKSDIGLKTVELLKTEKLIDDKVFQFLREDKSCSFFLLKLPEEMTDTEVKYRKYRKNEDAEFIYNSRGYYVARNWGIGNIGKFIDKIQKKFADIEYIVN